MSSELSFEGSGVGNLRFGRYQDSPPLKKNVMTNSEALLGVCCNVARSTGAHLEIKAIPWMVIAQMAQK